MMAHMIPGSAQDVAGAVDAVVGGQKGCSFEIVGAYDGCMQTYPSWSRCAEHWQK